MLSCREIFAAMALAVVPQALGCAGPQKPLASLDGLPPGTTMLRVANHLTGSEELERLTIAVDGETLELSSVPPPGGDPSTVGMLHLAPGAHAIAVRAVLRDGRAHGEVTVVGAQQPFRVQRGPASIGIDVHSALRSSVRSDLSAPASPVAVSLTMLGGRMTPPIDAPPDASDQRCASLQPMPRALCRAAVDLEEASRRNDVVTSLCLRDKLAEMHKLALVGELAEPQVVALSRQTERCIGDVVASPAPDGVTVTRVGAR